MDTILRALFPNGNGDDRMTRKLAAVWAACAAFLLPLAPARAADLVPPTEPPPAVLEEGWKFQATIYGWATSLNGDVGVRNLPPADVDVRFREILEHLDGAVMGSFLATNGKWLVLTDLVRAKISDSVGFGRFGGRADFEQKQTLAEGIVGYAIAGSPDWQLFGTAGVRYNRLNAELQVRPGLFPVAVTREGTQDWADPIVGLFLHYDMTDRWFLNAYADVGGFGVSSDITGQGFMTVGYKWTPTVSTAIGYRAIYTDYENDGFVYNITEYGPFASIAFHF
jgi:hypothetical protein